MPNQFLVLSELTRYTPGVNTSLNGGKCLLVTYPFALCPQTFSGLHQIFIKSGAALSKE
jgi:hypothetical protein